MGSCQCSKDLLFLKQNLSEIFIYYVEKNTNPKTTLQQQQKQQPLPSSTLINPIPNAQ